MFGREQLQKGGELFFYLLKNQIIPLSDTLAYDFINNPDIQEIVKTMAEQGGLRVFETRENIHMVSKGDDSIFATSYTQMKSKYKKLERKKHFYLANIIICIYLAEVDKEKNIRLRWEEEGITYYALENLITNQLESWKKRFDEEEGFSEDWGIAIEEIYDIWVNDFSISKQSKTGEIEVQRTRDNRFSFIHEALRPLADQNLIIDNTMELKILPKNELYERLDRLYHRQERYDEIMKLIASTKEEEANAQADQD